MRYFASAIIALILVFGCRNTVKFKVAKTSTVTVVDSYSLSKADTAFVPLTGSKFAIEDILSQRWSLEDVDKELTNDYFYDSVANIHKYPSLDLFADNAVAQDPRININLGTWSLDKPHGLLFLHFIDKTSATFLVDKLSPKKMKLHDVDKGVNLTFSGTGMKRRTPREDPFHPDNNKWRITPNARETNAQIRERVKGFVHFYYLYFADNRLRQEDDISFTGLPACFVWYNGGIGLKDISAADRKWISCFYDEADARKGYAMLKDVIESHSLVWPDPKHGWIWQTNEVLLQIEQKLADEKIAHK